MDGAVGGALPVALAVTAACSSLLLTGLVWVVHLVVYPAFALTSGADWPAYHRAHTRAITLAVAPPWAAQGLSALGLLGLRPDGLPLGLVVTHAALVALPVAVTVACSVPEHARLSGGLDPAALRRLLVTDRLRVAGWTGSGVTGTALLVLAARG